MTAGDRTSSIGPPPVVLTAGNGEDARAPFAVSSGATVTRLIDGRGELCQDVLAEEVPVAMVYNGISHAVMLSSPDHLDDLGLGFSLTEGIIGTPSELYDLELDATCQGVEIRMEIAARRFQALKVRRRALAGRTGCGLCGVESLDAVTRVDGRVVARGWPVPAAAVARALPAMQERQTLHRLTGSVHAVAWVSADGRVEALREDVGRHNALDKLIGHLIRGNVDPMTGFALTSSRASYEMVQKAVAAGIGMLVAVSAPTALAVRLAGESGLTLAGFARGNRVVVYSHPEFLTA
ncbi:MAG: formate dehydrogenase accessory sulfurtransferase FdhD [Telmatospirillum sp.]|nr:formate dehydrogenase accessory sulfurtransferase FdhD [Telmatospirillum sp.]